MILTHNDNARNITLMLTLNNPRAPFLPLWSICNFVFCDSSGLFGNFQTLAVISRINLGLRVSARQCAAVRGSARAHGSSFVFCCSDQSGLLASISQHVRLLDTFGTGSQISNAQKHKCQTYTNNRAS